MRMQSVQNTGEFFINGIKEGTGFAGAPDYINNPAAQCLQDLGPLPKGWYIMTDGDNAVTKHSIRLTPTDGTDMCGRHSMLIHGDSIDAPGTGSQGCIILRVDIRLKILKIIEDNRLKNKKTLLEVI